MSAVVEAQQLVKSYATLQALKGVSFAIRSGECYGFLGPNGAGKTTAMKILCCRIPRSGGTLSVLGHEANPQARAIKQAIGVVAQETALDPELNVLENLTQYARYFGFTGRQAKERARELLDFVQLSPKERAMINELSGGMKRRVMLARALLNRPRLLVLDEPTTGLDPQARLSVWDRLFTLRQQGVTIILTTHYMEEAARLCDRLAIMHQGQILCEGPPGALVRERVEPQVLELPADTPAALRAAGVLNGLASHTQRHGGMIYHYGHDASAMLRRLEETGLHPGTHMIRPANLEDLFLRLTGLELAD